MKRIGIALSLAIGACGARAESGADGLGGMLNELAAGLTATSTARLVDAPVLQALLPAVAGGLRRVEATSGAKQAMAARVSRTTGRYEGAGGARILIEISDWGTQARIAWGRHGLEAERDGESPRGYDRNAVIQGWPAVERLDRARQTGQIHLRVQERFIVSITGEKIGEPQLRQALNALDLKRLAALGRP